MFAQETQTNSKKFEYVNGILIIDENFRCFYADIGKTQTNEFLNFSYPVKTADGTLNYLPTNGFVFRRFKSNGLYGLSIEQYENGRIVETITSTTEEPISDEKFSSLNLRDIGRRFQNCSLYRLIYECPYVHNIVERLREKADDRNRIQISISQFLRKIKDFDAFSPHIMRCPLLNVSSPNIIDDLALAFRTKNLGNIEYVPDSHKLEIELFTERQDISVQKPIQIKSEQQIKEKPLLIVVK